jgi:DNA-binding protein YbaB
MSDPTNPNMLLEEIRKSMTEMQQQMQTTYLGLENMEITGEFEGITITITCTYKFVNIHIDPKAMQGGLKEFTHRIREAWSRACESVQKATQNKTMELLQNMQIPDEIRNMSADQQFLGEDDEKRRSGG